VLRDAVGELSPAERKALTGALEKVLARITRDRAHADQMCRLCDLAACPQRACPVELAARDHERPAPGTSPQTVVRP
jgi:MarR family transcriptional repressor of emrRAB